MSASLDVPWFSRTVVLAKAVGGWAAADLPALLAGLAGRRGALPLPCRCPPRGGVVGVGLACRAAMSWIVCSFYVYLVIPGP